jgi:hypothetical protein
VARLLLLLLLLLLLQVRLMAGACRSQGLH